MHINWISSTTMIFKKKMWNVFCPTYQGDWSVFRRCIHSWFLLNLNCLLSLCHVLQCILCVSLLHHCDSLFFFDSPKRCSKIIGQKMDFDTIKIFQWASCHINLDATLRDAEALCICADENGEALCFLLELHVHYHLSLL